MNAERLLALYGKVAEAPDAVPRLRRFVLDLAVRGKLVPQDAGDEPASELLKQIAAEKARLVKVKAIRKPRALPPNDPETWPFLLPKGWAWARLDELSPRSLTDGDWIETKDQSEDGGIRLIQLADVGVGTFLDKSARFITAETEVRLNCTRLAVGDVLIARLPNPIGRACMFPDIGQPAITAVDVAILRPDSNVAADYVVHALNAPPTRDQIEAYGKGATRFRVSTGHLKTVLLPLPPLAEQRRIVVKVQELMALLDRLEAARTAREATRDQLTAASLARLTSSDTGPDADAPGALPAEVGTGSASGNATTKNSFPANARFALATLPALTTRPDPIKPLRQTLLNLAVRGKLVEQDPTDEPVSCLVEKIRSEKKAAKQRSAEPDMTLVDFSMPSHWNWQSLDAILTIGPQNGLSPRKSERTDAPKAITLTATTSGTFDARQFKHVEVSTADAARYWLESGDLLFQRGNTRGYVGMAAIYDGPPEEFLFPDLIMRVKISPQVDTRFVHFWCIAPFARHFLSSNATGAQQTMPKINQGILRSLPVPLPPLAEQHRIVAKVDALMALCDRLEAALTPADTTRARLLEALLHEALEPAAEPVTEAAE